jgi:malate dehydrogenase (oxaloacetate-decarboxylating)(NADP+)
MIREQEALDYHSTGRKGKVEVVPTKPCVTQRDLSLAYTPGVAVPCLRIHENADDAYQYTAKGNLVAVVSNGTAVLGLGDIGALAGKPVMEGKGVLFKRFADIDVFDIEIDSHDPEEIIRTVKLLEPTFGGINLEDIKAPECFEIEERLREEMGIPVFHDDQHGTAIISGAALLNAVEIAGKGLDEVKVVFNGAGAAGVACADFYIRLGVRPENVILCDSKGVVYKGRTEGMNPTKERLAAETDRRTLAEALDGADVFVGLSVAHAMSPEMLLSMADDPIVFAMANPTPEIDYELAVATRSDVIMATGRSDFPNQVNNVLGFPFIFRGALDVRATTINEEMKLAATRALAELAKEDVPDAVMKAYGLQKLHFGREYLIPKPFDPRVLIHESAAVAQAAMDSGVAQRQVDIDAYKDELESRLGKARHVMRMMIHRAQQDPKRVVLPEGSHQKVLRAAQVLVDEGVAKPILLGDEAETRHRIADLGLNLDGVRIVQPAAGELFERYADEYYKMRQRKGVTLDEARDAMHDPNVWGAMMVRCGDADALVAGVTQTYPETLRPALRIIGARPDVHKVASVFMMIVNERVYFFADPTVNIDPTAEELADIAIMSAEVAQHFDVEPRIAMLSFSNFGSASHPFVRKVQKATRRVKRLRPDLMVDGDMQVDTALTPEIIDEFFPFSTLERGANVLVFPDLQSANMGFKLLHRLGGAEAVGPILMGMDQPVHILQRSCEAKDVVYMSAIAVIDAQEQEADRARRNAVQPVEESELEPVPV